jgi:pyridoxine 4-dehydrogenase
LPHPPSNVSSRILNTPALPKLGQVSNYGPNQLRKVHRFLKEIRNVQLCSVQVQLSLLCRDPAMPGNIIDVAKELDFDVIGYSPLSLGVLTGKYRLEGRLPEELPRRVLFKRLLRGSGELLAELEAVANEKNATMAQVATTWCLSKDVFVISGVRNEAQAIELMGSELELSTVELDRLELAASRARSQMVRNVFQTN